MNGTYLCAALLFCASWLMMVIAIAMPDWSNNTTKGGDCTVRVGLWSECLKVEGQWLCQCITEPIKNNGFMVTCRVLSIWGTVMVFLANITAYMSAFSCKTGWLTVVLAAISFFMLCITWGMWIGVHSDFFDGDGLGLGLASSFSMNCVASAFVLLGTCLPAFTAFTGRSKKPKDVIETLDPVVVHGKEIDEYGMNETPQHISDMQETLAGDVAPTNSPDVMCYIAPVSDDVP